MITLEEITNVIDKMQAQGIFTLTQANRLISAATAILANYGSPDEYGAKYQLFLGLISGKWI